MTARTYIDNAPTPTVTGAITSGQTSFTVSSLAGFPASFPYSVTLGLGTASAEQILVTAAVSTTVTVTRNSNGQGAFSHPDAETFDHTAVARDYSEANVHVNASSGVHGLSGSVVGTSDTQTLSNKTLSAPVFTGMGGGWTVPTLLAGYTAVAGIRPVRYKLDALGFVRIEGIFKDSSATNSKTVTLFTLPAGLRPAASNPVAFVPGSEVGLGGAGTVTSPLIVIQTTGNVDYSTSAITGTPYLGATFVFSPDA